MKLSVVALATVASAVAIDKRDAVFNVRNFTASCVPHSIMCSYSFNALMLGTMDTKGYNCTAFAPGAGLAALPEIKDGTCLPSSRTFDVVRSDKGLTLTVKTQVSRLSFIKGAHLIPNDQIKLIKGDTPTSDYQAYVGPKDFPLERID